MPLHTQREEDIKEFERKFTIWDNKHILADNQNEYIESKPFKDFISNIYIKIAEELDRRQKEGLETDWQEELNKLKA